MSISAISKATPGGSGDLESLLQQSKWFTRCWMLQELLASKELYFYDSKWTLIGSKDMLLATLTRITRIDQAALEDSACISDFSIGRRFSWAANLVSIRPEDATYSLLGIFGVSLAIIYGEGGQASFIRLQEEILKNTDDATILAWKALDSQRFRGASAHSLPNSNTLWTRSPPSPSECEGICKQLRAELSSPTR